MYKLLNFQDFFNDERQEKLSATEREIALSLISPNQMVHAVPDDERCKFHLTLSLEIISDIYKIVKPTNMDYQIYNHKLIKEINKHIENDERNFIIIRYGLLKNNRFALIEYPMYITEYEYECMQNLRELYREYCIETEANINHYDPINCCEAPGITIGFESDDQKSALDYSLDYLTKSKSIINYNLKAPKEYILK